MCISVSRALDIWGSDSVGFIGKATSDVLTYSQLGSNGYESKFFFFFQVFDAENVDLTCAFLQLV